MQFFEYLFGLRLDGGSGLLEIAFLILAGLASLAFLFMRISALGGPPIALRGGIDDGSD